MLNLNENSKAKERIYMSPSHDANLIFVDHEHLFLGKYFWSTWFVNKCRQINGHTECKRYRKVRQKHRVTGFNGCGVNPGYKNDVFFLW